MIFPGPLMAISIVLRPILSTEIFGIRFLDVPVYIAVSLVLLAVSIVAAALPARRVASVDPTEALRSE
jgi:ABC-type lipoprotein release transport system permease subunit